MGPRTKKYQQAIIDIAKVRYFETLSSVFPDKDWKITNIQLYIEENKEWFTLHMCDSDGVVVHEESFKFSDF